MLTRVKKCHWQICTFNVDLCYLVCRRLLFDVPVREENRRVVTSDSKRAQRVIRQEIRTDLYEGIAGPVHQLECAVARFRNAVHVLETCHGKKTVGERIWIQTYSKSKFERILFIEPLWFMGRWLPCSSNKSLNGHQESASTTLLPRYAWKTAKAAA